MKCSFFGHSFGFYQKYEDKLLIILKDLITNKNVDTFYMGSRGDFDAFCTRIVKQIKKDCPHIKIYLVLAYMPKPNTTSAESLGFDGSVYLLEKAVPPRLSIIETNKSIVDITDFIVSGVYSCSGGAFQAVQYARKKHKEVIVLCDDRC